MEIDSSAAKPENIAVFIAEKFRSKKDVTKGEFYQKHRAAWDKARNPWEFDPKQKAWIKRDPKPYSEEYESHGANSSSSSGKDSK